MVGFYMASFLFLVLHILFGVLLSKEVFLWPALSMVKKSLLIFSIWFVPVFGAIISYKVVKLDWFGKSGSSSGSSGSALVEMDSFFNPGAKHRVEAQQEARVEIREDKRKDKVEESGTD